MDSVLHNILHADEETVLVTWDAIHIMLTLIILIALIIIIWLSRLNKCVDNEPRNEGAGDDYGIPKCIDADKSCLYRLSGY